MLTSGGHIEWSTVLLIKEVPHDTFRMNGFHQMSNLHVPFVGLQEGPPIFFDQIRYWSQWQNEQLLVCCGCNQRTSKVWRCKPCQSWQTEINSWGLLWRFKCQFWVLCQSSRWNSHLVNTQVITKGLHQSWVRPGKFFSGRNELSSSLWRLWPDSGQFNCIPRINIGSSCIWRNVNIPQAWRGHFGSGIMHFWWQCLLEHTRHGNAIRCRPGRYKRCLQLLSFAAENSHWMHLRNIVT